MISSLEIESHIVDIDEEIEGVKNRLDGIGQSGLVPMSDGWAFMCLTSEGRMCLYATLDQLQSIRDDLEYSLFNAKLVEEEAVIRNCTPDEIIALREGKCTYIPDYDDHSSDDCRAEHNILCEVGMHIETNPFALEELEL